MQKTPHKEKLLAALDNPKCHDDISVLNEALEAYKSWVGKLTTLKTSGKARVLEMTKSLNDYKDYLETDLIAEKGTPFLRRQKGQLKLDNSVVEEFLIHLVAPSVINGLPKGLELEVGPQTAFMSLSFRPSRLSSLGDKPEVVVKLKDQDFTIGKTLYYKFSPNQEFKTNPHSMSKCNS